MHSYIQKSKEFILRDIWHIKLKDQSPRRGFFIQQLKVLLLAFRGFNEDRVQSRASELTYYSILSVVPIMAMIIGVAKGFGFQERVEDEIKTALDGQGEVLNYVLSFTQRFIESIQGGVFAGIGLVFLVYTVMKMFSNIERSFNDIWQVRKSRSFSRKFSDYLSMLLIAPMLILLASGANVFIQGIAADYALFQSLDYIVKILFAAIPYVLIWILFTLIYIIMPNTKVNFRYALIAGIIAGTMFQILQWAYITFQGSFSRYNAVYGTFAALPLFLIWLQTSWLIVLLGAEISFAYQNVENYEHEVDSLKITKKDRQALTLLVAYQVIKRFANSESPLTAAEIAHQLEIPNRLIQEITYELVEAGIFSELATPQPKEIKFQPAVDIHLITITFLLKKLEERGSESYHPVSSDKLSRIKSIQKDFFESIENHSENKLLKDI